MMNSSLLTAPRAAKEWHERSRRNRNFSAARGAPQRRFSVPFA
jgi:hypothetical protein